MRFISFPFHGLEQLVEYNRNGTTVKRFLPIYASRCTRYPHYESPPAKTQSFPQHCRYTGKRCFQQFVGESRSQVATSSGDAFPAVRTHRRTKNQEKESRWYWPGTPNPLHLAKVLSATQGRSREKHVPPPRQHLPSTHKGIAVENQSGQ